MTVATVESLDGLVIRSPWQEAWRRFKKDRFACVCLVIFGLFLLLATAAQVVEFVESTSAEASVQKHAYQATVKKLLAADAAAISAGLKEASSPPSLAHPLLYFGTTAAGKSVILHIFHGTKVAFVVGCFSALLSVLIGMTLGLLAGFFGRWVDVLVVFFYSTLASIPYLLLLLSIAFMVREGSIAETYKSWSWISDHMSLGLFMIVIIIGLTSWVTLCRLVRAEVMKVRELDYVQAARSLGIGNMRILFKHILPNVFHLVIINFSLTFVIAIKSEVILTFLGVGVDKEPSWGRLIADAQNQLMNGIWWPLLAAGGMLFVLTLSVNYVGDALRDALDPKLRQ